MAFVNEYISEENIKKYDIEALDKKFRKGHYKPHWTIDHERNMYLRYVRIGREEHSGEITFCFYWQKQLFEVTVKQTAAGGARLGEQWAHYDLLYIEPAFSFARALPDALKVHQAEILTCLKEALTAYKELGILSKSTKFTATFGF